MTISESGPPVRAMLPTLVLALLPVLVPPAGAQTCAAPVPIPADPIPVSGDTCLVPNSLPTIGPIPSPHNDFVLTFVGHPAMQGHLHVQGHFDGAVYLLPGTCDASTEPVVAEFFAPGDAVQVPVAGLQLQPYYVVVTGDPGSLPNTCGQFLLVAQTQIADVIFQDDFE